MRLIEKNFPILFRAGANIERNDLSQWLENFIPFDFSNRSRKLSKNKIEYQKIGQTLTGHLQSIFL